MAVPPYPRLCLLREEWSNSPQLSTALKLTRRKMVDTVEKETIEESTNSVNISSLDCEFETENYVGELDFPALGIYQLPKKEVEALATKTAKQKFRYPSKDPAESELVDERPDQEILEDILRISSQILTPDELTLWNEIACQDLSHSMKFNNDILVPKMILDQECRRHKKLKKEKDNLLETVSDFEPDIGVQINSARAEITVKKRKTLMQLNQKENCYRTVRHLQAQVAKLYTEPCTKTPALCIVMYMS